MVLAVAWILSLPIAMQFGEAGIRSSAVAAVMCWLSGANVTWLGCLFRDEQQAFIKVAGSLTLRTSMPLVGLLWLVQSTDWAEKGGLAFYLIVFYQVMLANETTLDVAQLEAAAADKQKADKDDQQDPPAS